MYAKAEFFGVDLYGNPVKRSYTLPLEPIFWPTRPDSIIVRVFGEVDEGLIERARDLGWGYNPNTQSFYRLD